MCYKADSLDVAMHLFRHGSQEISEPGKNISSLCKFCSWASYNRSSVAWWESEISLSSLLSLNKNVSLNNDDFQSEAISKLKTEIHVSDQMSAWVGGWMSGWVGEWVSEWVGGWVSEWLTEWVSERVRDVCISHQSDWIYYKQPIEFLVFVAGTCNMILLLVSDGNLKLLCFWLTSGCN